MKLKSLLLILMLSGAMLSSCTYDIIKPKELKIPETVSFAENIIPVFNKSCNVSGCHSNSGIPPNLTATNAYISLTFFGYVNVDLPKESLLYKKIETGTMKQYAIDQDRAIILKWIEQGALDN